MAKPNSKPQPYSDYMLGVAMQLVTLLSADTYNASAISALVEALREHLDNGGNR